MNRAPLLVLIATGGLLVTGTLGSIFSTPRHDTAAIKVIFESAEKPAPAGPEPLFPGQP